jgi:hypothetical protein
MGDPNTQKSNAVSEACQLDQELARAKVHHEVAVAFEKMSMLCFVLYFLLNAVQSGGATSNCDRKYLSIVICI